jgi:hypothetical protein
MGIPPGDGFHCYFAQQMFQICRATLLYPGPFDNLFNCFKAADISKATGVPITNIISKQVKKPLIQGLLINAMFFVESSTLKNYGSFYNC